MDEMKKEVPAKFAEFVKNIETMSVLDLHELVKTLESHFGVSAAAVAVSGGAGAGAEVAEAKDAYTLHLVSVGEAKIAVMKVIKEALGLGLKEAKDMVDGAPVDVKAGLKKAEADALKKQIEEAGGKVELK